MERSIEMGLERHAVVRDLPEITQAEDLIAPAVGQDRFLPMDEGMKASQPPDCLMTGSEIEVVGVSKNGFSI